MGLFQPDNVGTERSCDEEMINADMELETLLCFCLDRCLANGAREDDLKLLASKCGVTNWEPNGRLNCSSGVTPTSPKRND